MPRRRWVFTENGKPLPKPVEVPVDEKPSVPEALRVPAAEYMLPSGKAVPVTEPAGSGGNWVDFQIPERKK